MIKHYIQLLFLWVTLSWASGVLAVTGWWADNKLLAADAGKEHQFGLSVSLSGDRMVVGAGGDAGGNGYPGFKTGSAYVFEYDGENWVQTAKLLADDGIPADWFGFSVSLSGQRVVVGAPWDKDLNGFNSGSAYVFEYGGVNWVQTAKLLAVDAAPSDFGDSISLSGDRVVVGARGSYLGDVNGAAYVFEYDGANWIQAAKLLAADGVPDDRFADSVSLSGDRVVVGAGADDDLGSDSGSVYVFEYDGTNWVQTAKLLAADGASDDSFGDSVSLSGDRVVVGAAEQDYSGGHGSGSAYVFEYDGVNWVQSAKLLAADGASGDRFGLAVSLSGDRVVVAAHSDEDLGTNSGSAYVFEYDGANWTQTAKLLAADGTAWDSFGQSVSLSGNRVVVGAVWDENFGDDSGSAHVFGAVDVIDPLPDVKVNGVDGPLTLSATQEITLSGRLLAGEGVGDVDFWLFAETPEGTYYYLAATKSWVPYMVPAFQGPIKDVWVQALLEASSDYLPRGTSLIRGGVDLVPNGVLDEPMYLDSMEVTNTTPTMSLKPKTIGKLPRRRY